MNGFVWALLALVAVGCGYIAVEHQALALGLAGVGVLAALLPLLSGLRVKIERHRSSAAAPELLMLPLLLEGRVFTGGAFALVIVLGLIAFLATRQKTGSVRPLIVAAAMFTLALPFSRPFGSELLFLSLALPLAVVTLLAMSARRRDFHTFVTSLVDGLGIYLVVNVAAYFAGVVSPAAAARTGALEGLGGATRIIFPITGSLATPAALAAIYIAASAICLERSGGLRRSFRLLAFAAAVFVLVGASTRAAMVVAVLLLLAGLLSTHVLARTATVIAAASIAFGFIYGFVQPLVTSVLAGIVTVIPGFSRGGLVTDTTLNFRSVIWERTLDYWPSMGEIGGQLFGYGIRGQQTSGASLLYAANLAGISTDPRGTSVHNSYVQQLFDGGLIGLLIFAALLIWGARRLGKALKVGASGGQIALPALLAAVMTGMTEVTLAPGYGLAGTYLALGLAMAVATVKTQEHEATLPGDDRTVEGAAARVS